MTGRPERRGAHRLEALWQDLSIGARVLRKSPAFTLSAIVTLALGIGANAAVFTVVDDLILRPLSYEHADRLVTVLERHEKGGSANMPYANFVDIEAQSHAFDGLGAYGAAPTTVIVRGKGLRVRAGVFTAGFFKVFSTRPVLGRLPSADESRPGASPVAVVSYAFWRDQLGSPASLDTVRITLGQSTPVIGVLPNGFDFPDGNQIWLPMESMTQSMSRTAHNWDVVGRLRDGVGTVDARHDVDGILSHLKALYSPQFDAAGAEITPLQAAMTSSLRAPLLLLLAASALLLLGACVNIASTLLARATARSAEFAVRSALGATRQRLMRQLLTESVLLAFLGCAAGLVLAEALLRALPLIAPSAIRLERVHLDLRVEGVALVVAAATAVMFGLLPALRLSGRRNSLTLREGSRGTAGAARMRAWNVLVGAEVALAVILLSGSALLIRSFARVMETPLGFETQNVYTVDVDLPPATYGDSSASLHAFHERALDRLRHANGIEAAGLANRLPLGGNNPSGGMIVEGKPLDPRGPFNGNAVYRIIGGDFFAAMGIPVLRGRVFRAGDDDPRAPVVVVNEEFATKEWPGEDPIGKRVKVSGMDFNGADSLWSTVVGVVGNVRAAVVTGPYRETYYFDHRTRPGARTRSASYAIKSRLPVSVLGPLVRREIAAIDPEVPVVIRTMGDRVAQTVADRRFTMLVLGAFATVALLLAIVGIYGVVSYAVAQRTREIGVRLALGATAGEVRRLILGSAMRAVVPGLAAGALLAVGAAQALRTMLYGVTPFDAAALAGAIGVLGASATVSSLLPAMRATRVDPIITMRAE